MCAICGIIDFDSRKIDQNKLIAMRDMMFNRGPDAGGIKIVNESVGLGHRRLKIIDISDAANQPMANENESIWTVFNGEIYNFIELREILIRHGHVFQTKSDTETIVHGYEQWGEDLFTKLDGMFAIAIWDNKNERLLLARDRYGKKPLYYQYDGKRLSFASEIKALWKVSDKELQINEAAVDCYFHHFSTTQNHCIFRDIQKLSPGHFAVFTNSKETTNCYWKPTYKNKVSFTELEAIHAIDQSLRKAVSKRLISDVPLGAFLSGGIDSSLVVAMLSQVSEKTCQTFSIGFEEQDFSELKYSAAVANHYGTQHEEIILKPDIIKILPSLVYEYGEPFADSSAIPMYYVSKAARSQVTVALTGDGGDELFGGYDIARASYYSSLMMNFCPKTVQNGLERLLFSPYFENNHFSLIRKMKTLLTHASNNPNYRHSITMAFNQWQKRDLYKNDFTSQLNCHNPAHIFLPFAKDIEGLNIIDQNLFLTMVGRLPNDYLIKVDVASMKNSLEIRSPFLDSGLSELAQSIDPKLKVRHGIQKYLLKKLAERYLPHEVIYRKKRGFELPLTHWFRTSLGTIFQHLVLGNGCLQRRGWFHMDYIRKILVEHQNHTHDHTHRLWSLLWLEIWFRLFIEQSLMPTDSLDSM